MHHYQQKKRPKPYDKPKTVCPKWCVYDSPEKADSCILALPGRGQSGFWIAGLYSLVPLPRTAIIGITPKNCEWYPQPNGAYDQREAVASLPFSLMTLYDIIRGLSTEYGIHPNRVSVVGFSAGAVMAVQCIAKLNMDLAAIVSHAGAILDPKNLPDCNVKTPILVFHNEDDEAFKWYERFRPMEEALIRRKYQHQTVTRETGGHQIFEADLKLAAKFIGQQLGYSEEILSQFDEAVPTK